MQTFTEIVAAVVVSSSAAAYSHFGVTLDAQQVEKPAPVERTVARTANPKTSVNLTSKTAVKAPKSGTLVRQLCPEERARMLKA